jgi:hypothetical protein
MSVFDNVCINFVALDSCSKSIIKGLEMSQSEIDKCVSDSYATDDKSYGFELKADNALLRNERA